MLLAMASFGRPQTAHALRIAALSCGLGLVAASAWAEPPAPGAAPTATSDVSAADKDTARHLMDVGDARFEAKDYAGALQAYREADRLMGVPSTGVALGRAQEKLGLLVEARDTLLRVGRYPVEPHEPAVFTLARTEAVALAGAIQPRVPSLTFEVTGPPAGSVEITLGEAVVSGASVATPRLVDPGQLEIRCRAEGFREARQTVTLAEGEQRLVRFALEPAPVAPEPPAKPATKPATKPAPAPGLPPGAADTGDGGVPVWAWIGFGTAAAGAIAGTITGVLSLERVSDLGDACPGSVCAAEQQGDIDTMNTLANVSNVSFAVAGAGLAVGIVGALVGSSGGGKERASARRGIQLTPVVGPGAIFITGRF